MFGFGKKKRLKTVCVAAAVLSLACGASIFPHLREYGLKVDEFATEALRIASGDFLRGVNILIEYSRMCCGGEGGNNA